MRMVIYVASAAALALAFRFAVAPSEGAEEADGKVRVSVDELGKTAELIGRLSKPLGTWVTINGKWSLPAPDVKDDSLRFTVTHVDGAKLKKPVEFDAALVHALDRRGNDVSPKFEDRDKFNGRTWTLKAYETGRFHITPPEYDKAIGIVPGSMQEPYWIARPFTSEIKGVLQPE